MRKHTSALRDLMTGYTQPPISSEVVRANLGSEPSPPPGPFSQSQRPEPGACLSSKGTLPTFLPPPLLTMTRERVIVQLRKEALLIARREEGHVKGEVCGDSRGVLSAVSVSTHGPLGLSSA